MNRTGQQNRSLHKYLSMIAEALADSGQDMRKIVTLPIRPTMENVKESMFKPVMSALYPDIESTAKLTTIELQAVYEVFNAAVGERLGVSFPFPSLDEQINESRVADDNKIIKSDKTDEVDK